jgi:hypothetical protein
MTPWCTARVVGAYFESISIHLSPETESEKKREKKQLTATRLPMTLLYGFPTSSDPVGTSNSTVYAAASATAFQVIS